MAASPYKPKFMTDTTFNEIKASIAVCERCHAERTLPPGRTASIGICTDCCRELEYDLKKRLGTLPEGEERPRRANRPELKRIEY